MACLKRGGRQCATALAVLISLTITRSVARAAPPAATDQQPRREFNIVPLVGGDSDVGIGFGQVSDLAKLAPGCQPFCWKLESAAFISFKVRESKLVVPFQDYYLMYSDPQLGRQGQWRLDLRAAFTKESTLLFYGIGNASPLPPPGSVRADSEYRRIHPTAAGLARLALAKAWFIEGGLQYTYNQIEVTDTSLLLRLRAGGSAAAPFLRDDITAPHGVGLMNVGLLYDSRDSEVVTRRGMFHTVHVRLSPPLGPWLPYAYEQLDATARFYITPSPRWLTLSYRLVGDVFFGSPPFYELARYEETAAIGGVKGVRGVPAQRYYGKVKLFQNLEARSEIWPFKLLGKPMVLGVALFADAGRVWSELLTSHPDLDGTGLGLKYGLGGGIRLQQGETFVVRIDLAWSPDAHPIGAYFAAGEIF